MRRFSAWVPIVLVLLFSLPLAAQEAIPQGRPGRRRTFSVSGVVRDAANNNTINGAKVDLQGVTGGTISTTFTGTLGNFEFAAVAAGTYNLSVEQPGYGSAMQSVDVGESPVLGIEIDLRRTGNDKNDKSSPNGPSAKISAHELAAPHKAQDLMAKGVRLLYDKMDYHGSIAEFQRAVQAYPDYYEAYAQMGIAYVNLGDSANAEMAFRKSYDLSGEKYLDACFLLAKLLSFGHRFAEAEPIARKAAEIDPASWQANEELARALVGLNRFEDAEPSANEADKLMPDQPGIQLLLADIHMKTHNYPALLQNLDAYLRLTPNGPQADKVRQAKEQVQQALASGAPGAPQPAPSTGGNPAGSPQAAPPPEQSSR